MHADTPEDALAAPEVHAELLALADTVAASDDVTQDEGDAEVDTDSDGA